MNRLEFTPELLPAEDIKTFSENTEQASADFVSEKISATEAKGALQKWQNHLSEINTELASGLITRSMARTEIDVILKDLVMIGNRWQGRVAPQIEQSLKDLQADFRQVRKTIASPMEKMQKWFTVPLVGLGILGATKANEHYHAFSEAQTISSELVAAEHEFVPPPVPDSFLVVPEKAQVADTQDLYAQYAKFVREHEEKGLDLSIEESKPGLLGTYLKFGRQIDRNVNFSEVFLPKIAERTQISEADLQTIQDLFHKSIYEQPPTMGNGTGTSSIFYCSESVLKFNEHEDFYAQQVANDVVFAKNIIPQLEQMEPALRAAAEEAVANFLEADLVVRAYDERIKDAIANQREFELEGVSGAYNDDVPSLFKRQEASRLRRDQAIVAWYETVAKINPAASLEKNVVQLAVNLQGWADKRATALAVSQQEVKEGVLLGSPFKWNEFVQKGDEEYRQNEQALETLLATYPSKPITVATK